MSKRLTVIDLLKNKEKYQVKKDVTQDVYVERLGADILVRKPEKSLIAEAMQMSQDENQSEKADAFMVYNIVVEPNLKDAELQKEFGCKEPMDIVEEIFETGEITQIVELGFELAGYKKGAVTIVKDLKN